MNQEQAHTFPKSEKLCGRLQIDRLYKQGRHFTAYPMRVTFLFVPESSECPQLLVWAPKSRFRRANKRNRMRRLMREAYRLNANLLKQQCQEQSCSLHIAFNLISAEESDYTVIERAVKKALVRLQQELTIRSAQA
ncbi:MAG: ribonuclease P protein component [Paludibacter sp.]|nr:ribonuclease P protein component [Bacteroidales bacterium]MCM1068667.1 ribonuclease P protein component [Prevotella sp.]MCM1353331.1 ribonuclease P protein component [Bacteroides sp.]MCM1442261.1 ribonuclease P protein component [Muribaculum sp.]MCM1481080.1 ribonuclease P protein component [Paludibacter sp.]